jgi:hypothetical protein
VDTGWSVEKVGRDRPRAFDKPPTPPAWHIGLSKLWTPTGAIASPPQRGLTFHRHQSYGDADPTLSAGQI